MQVYFHLLLPLEETLFPLLWEKEEVKTFSLGNRGFQLTLSPRGERKSVELTLLSGEEIPVFASLLFQFDDWNKENYLFMPGAVYNGNRTQVLEGPYYPEPDRQLLTPPQTTFAIRRLERDGGGTMEFLSGEFTFPAFAFFSEKEKRSCWILSGQGSSAGDHSFSVTESEDGKKMTLKISAPACRKMRQSGGRKFVPAMDTPFLLKKGERLTLEIASFWGACESLAQFFHQGIQLRNFMLPEGKGTDLIPFSRVVRLIRERLEKENWREEYGYYATLTKGFIAQHPELPFHYQLGWVGGGMRTEYLLLDGDPLSRQHAERELESIFQKAQLPSGFFMTTCENGSFYPDLIPSDRSEKPNCHTLLRKNADALAFLARQMLHLKAEKAPLRPGWLAGVEKSADAFASLWERYGLSGYFLDPHSARITFGGGTGGALSCAGLIMAWELLGKDRYRKAALESLGYLIREYLHKGNSYGGVGDAVQVADSESACALLEAIVTVWEYTGKEELLPDAGFAADLLASWCVSYDYKFPPESIYGKLQMETCGTVYANTQNRHSAPGFCSGSGDALFKLYRATGKKEYAELLRRIVHALPQYVSREDRPIGELGFSYINERINMGDWDGKEFIGHAFNCSCWPETSILLTRIHIPGIYVNVENGDLFAFDHIKAEWTRDKEALCLTNPTDFPAEVTILAENGKEARIPLKTHAWRKFRKFPLGAGEKLLLDRKALAEG